MKNENPLFYFCRSFEEPSDWREFDASSHAAAAEKFAEYLAKYGPGDGEGKVEVKLGRLGAIKVFFVAIEIKYRASEQ